MELNRCIGYRRSLSSRKRRSITPPRITIPSAVVRYLRKGVREQMASTLARLSIETAVAEPDLLLLDRDLVRFDEARALAEEIGWSDVPEQPDLDLDLARWPNLILSALDVQLKKETARLIDALTAGFKLTWRDATTLSVLVAQVRNAIEPRPHRRMLRPLRRNRGDD